MSVLDVLRSHCDTARTLGGFDPRVAAVTAEALAEAMRQGLPASNLLEVIRDQSGRGMIPPSVWGCARGLVGKTIPVDDGRPATTVSEAGLTAAEGRHLEARGNPEGLGRTVLEGVIVPSTQGPAGDIPSWVNGKY